MVCVCVCVCAPVQYSFNTNINYFGHLIEHIKNGIFPISFAFSVLFCLEGHNEKDAIELMLILTKWEKLLYM